MLSLMSRLGKLAEDSVMEFRAKTSQHSS
jgi:hypothetical protein